MSLLPVGIGSSGSYEIAKSLRFRASASAYLSRTPGSAGNRRTWTWSSLVKRGNLGASNALFSAGITSVTSEHYTFNPSDQLQVFDTLTGVTLFVSTAVYRDPSSHYHVQFVYDSTNATASERIRVFVNGSRISGTVNVALNRDSFVNFTVLHAIGAITFTGGPAASYLDGYLSEINFIDGQALTPSSFGETDPVTGVWVPKKYTGTYGTNGFYLPFNDGSSLGNLTLDRSGNGNNWTATNVSLTAGATYDWMDDTPTNNFCTLNPVINSNFPFIYTNANLNGQLSAGSNAPTRTAGTVGFSGGKYYWECAFQTDVGAGEWGYIGIARNGANFGSSTVVGFSPDEWVFVDTGFRRHNSTSTAYGTPQASSFTLRVAVDADAGKIWWGDSSGWFSGGDPAAGTGEAYSGLSGSFIPFIGVYRSTATSQFITANFGQHPFQFSAPTGFLPLCTKNLPLPTIQNPRQHFDVTTYTGTGASRSITGLAFAPDLVWMKSRGRAVDHALYDRVRGVQAQLESNQTGVETTETTGLTAFNSDGWTMGALDQINSTTATNSYVGWSWKANGAAVTNTAGTISSQVSANTQAGFSIVTYTGTGANATVGHGLGVAPRMVIVKNRATSTNWTVYHAGMPPTQAMFLNLVNANTTAVDWWNNTAPTSSVFSLGINSGVNGNAQTQIAYCFAEIPGFSRIGSYTGNNTADNAFVWCGFRPAFVMIKCSSTTGNWVIVDARRQGFNVDNDPLFPNLPNVEGTTDLLDTTANGFKVRSTNADVGAAQTYVFMAFAESPFNTSRAR
jgi:hypothetical protein